MKKQSNPPPPDKSKRPPPPPSPPATRIISGNTIMDRFAKWLAKPMTEHDYNSAMAMAGRKRCPHCKEWL